MDRREVIMSMGAGACGLALLAGKRATAETGAKGGASGSAAAVTKLPSFLDVPLELVPLPYPYNALEPVIDEETMRLHHDKHHAGYVKKLTAGLEGHDDMLGKPLSSLLRHLGDVPTEVRTVVRNQGGGHLNHTLFWRSLSAPHAEERLPQGKLLEHLVASFETVAKFQAAFVDAGLSLFGSGWVWLVLDPRKKLSIIVTHNQDNPLSDGLIPLLGNDVWEHAYYLKYRNDRSAYLQAWWRVVNWGEVAKRLEESL